MRAVRKGRAGQKAGGEGRLSTDVEMDHRVMASVVKRTIRHFREMFGMEFISMHSSSGEIKALTLRALTALIGIGCPVGVLVAFSFDGSLAEHLLDVEMAGIDIASEERPHYLLEVAAETINIVLGHCTADLAEAGNVVMLSAPVVLDDGGKLRRPAGALFTRVSQETEHGMLDIDFITPRHLFGELSNPTAG
jgi:CheY-specific phosphatase CheX